MPPSLPKESLEVKDSLTSRVWEKIKTHRSEPHPASEKRPSIHENLPPNSIYPRCIPYVQFCFETSRGLQAPLEGQGLSFHSSLNKNTKKKEGFSLVSSFNTHIYTRQQQQQQQQKWRLCSVVGTVLGNGNTLMSEKNLIPTLVDLRFGSRC